MLIASSSSAGLLALQSKNEVIFFAIFPEIVHFFASILINITHLMSLLSSSEVEFIKMLCHLAHVRGNVDDNVIVVHIVIIIFRIMMHDVLIEDQFHATKNTK